MMGASDTRVACEDLFGVIGESSLLGDHLYQREFERKLSQG